MIPTLQLGQFGRGAAESAALDQWGAIWWAVLSIKKLVGAYAGSAIRVRESGGNTEADIGFLGTTLDTAALLAHTGANDGFVTKLYDQQGNGNHVQQATTTKQPRIVAAGVYDGFIRFDGTNDCLTSANVSGTPTALTLFTKGNMRTPATQSIPFEHGPSGPTAGDNTFSYLNAATSQLNIFVAHGAAYRQNAYNSTALTGNVHAVRCDRALAVASWSIVRADGSPVGPTGGGTVGSPTVGTAFTAETWNVGARNNGASDAAALNLYTLLISETAIEDGRLTPISVAIA